MYLLLQCANSQPSILSLMTFSTEKNIRVNRRAAEIRAETLRSLRSLPKTQVNVTVQPWLVDECKTFFSSIRKAVDEEHARAVATRYTNSEWADHSHPEGENCYPIIAVLYQTSPSGTRRVIKEQTFVTQQPATA